MALLAKLADSVDPALRSHAVGDPPPGRFEGRLEDPVRALVVEAVREGFELHHGEPRAFERMDADLRLLAGDALYALAVERLAERGDLAAITELADVISLSARAVSERRPELVEPLWEATVAALSSAGGAGARAATESLFADGSTEEDRSR